MKVLLCLSAALATLSLAGCKPSVAATPYPFETCPISGQKLGAHGDPYVFSRDGQEVKLCCEACLEDFDKDAATLLPKIKSRTPIKVTEKP